MMVLMQLVGELLVAGGPIWGISSGPEVPFPIWQPVRLCFKVSSAPRAYKSVLLFIQLYIKGNFGTSENICGQMIRLQNLR